MSAVIDTTIGGTASNSYVTQAEAQAYFDARLDADAWTSAGSDKQIRALISATRRLDEEQFDGIRASTTQSLKWPRNAAHMADISGYYMGDYFYSATIIPQEMKDATCEMALALLANDLLADTGLEGFEKVKIGPIEVTPRMQRQAGALPADVRRKIAHVLDTPSISNVRLTR